MTADLISIIPDDLSTSISSTWHFMVSAEISSKTNFPSSFPGDSIVLSFKFFCGRRHWIISWEKLLLFCQSWTNITEILVYELGSVLKFHQLAIFIINEADCGRCLFPLPLFVYLLPKALWVFPKRTSFLLTSFPWLERWDTYYQWMSLRYCDMGIFALYYE